MTDDEVHQLLNNVSPAIPIWQRYRDPDNQRKGYRDASGRLSGLLVFSTNGFHPHALGMTVYAHDPQLFPLILADAVREAHRQHKDRLVTWGYPPLSAFTDWLVTQGFAVWRQTLNPTTSLDRIRVLAAGTDQCLTATQVLADPALKAQLVTLSLANYRRVHAINPLAPVTAADWEHLLFSEVLLAAPLVLVRQGRIAAYTFAFEDEPRTMNWAWLGATRRADLWHLQAVQIAWAQQRGMRQLAGEFDSTDALAWATARHWPFDPAPAYTMLGKRL